MFVVLWRMQFLLFEKDEKVQPIKNNVAARFKLSEFYENMSITFSLVNRNY